MRRLIGFDANALGKLNQPGRDRMGTPRQLADDAFADLLQNTAYHSI